MIILGMEVEDRNGYLGIVACSGHVIDNPGRSKRFPPEAESAAKEQIETALENGYKTITLGENRLRTETAALFACMNAKLLVG